MMKKAIKNEAFKREVTDYYVNDLVQNWLGFYYINMSSNEVQELKALILAWLKNKEKI